MSRESYGSALSTFEMGPSQECMRLYEIWRFEVLDIEISLKIANYCAYRVAHTLIPVAKASAVLRLFGISTPLSWFWGKLQELYKFHRLWTLGYIKVKTQSFAGRTLRESIRS